MSSRLSRRELVAAGSAAAAAGLLALGHPGAAAAQGTADLRAVLDSVRFEQALGVAYAHMAQRSRLGRDLRDLLTHLAEHERRHAAALLALLEYLGGRPPAVPSLVQAEAALPGVRTAVDRRSALAVLDQLERAELLGFYSAQQILTDAKLIQHVGAVMCSDAQHLVLVRELAGQDPIPTPFEAGHPR